MNNDKNLLAGFVMVVGVVFVLIAGGIFATTAWAYLPEIVKQLFLLMLTAAFFGVSCLFNKRQMLPKTELALFYLGVAFLGYCSISFLGGGNFPPETNEDDARLFVASLIMLLPVAYRLYTGYDKELQGQSFHFAVLLILTDSVLVWGAQCLCLETGMKSVVAAGTLLAYGIANYYGQNFLRDNKGPKIIFYIAFIWHAFVFGSLWISNAGYRDNEEELVLALLLCLATHFLWKAGRHVVLRGLNSLLLLYFVYMLAVNIWPAAITDVFDAYDEGALFLAFSLCILLMLVLQRGEMIFILVRFASLMAIVLYVEARFESGLENFQLFNLVCMMGVGLLPLAMHVKESWEKGEPLWSCLTDYRELAAIYKEDEKGRRYLAAAMLQGVIAIALAFWFAYEDWDSVALVMFIITLGIACSALLSEWRMKRKILWTLALFPGMGIFLSQSLIDIPWEFSVEYTCFWIEIAIIIFGFIWHSSSEYGKITDADAMQNPYRGVYDDGGKTCKLIQFILNCVQLATLLLWNMHIGELPNALILGACSMILILAAGYLHKKQYMIAGTVTLFLLVVYATRDLWLDIAWWVYLLIAGIILIMLASRSFYRNSNSSLPETDNNPAKYDSLSK